MYKPQQQVQLTSVAIATALISLRSILTLESCTQSMIGTVSCMGVLRQSHSKLKLDRLE